MKINLFLLFLSLAGFLKSQENPHRCGFDLLLENNPKVSEQLKKNSEKWKSDFNNQQFRRNYIYNYDTTYIVKVVFHVLYNNTSENIPDSTIITQMQVINEDFNRQNRDTNATRQIFKGVAGSMRIRFELATVGPNGLPTNGITRTFTTINSFSNHNPNLDERMKYNSNGGKDAWDTDNYLNVWVCDMFPTNPSNGFVAGYATPPNDAPNWSLFYPKEVQGAVVHFSTVGRFNITASSNNSGGLGRTLTHELGHYFGLFHTWGIASNCNTSNDDYIDDTPNTRESNFNCNFVNTCTDPINDLPDQIENYMDYALGRCQNIFTAQQAALMKYNINTHRKSIYTTEVSVDSVIGANVDAKPRILFNPKNELHLTADIFTQTLFSVELYDMVGRKILTRNNVKLNGPFMILGTELIANGQYIVKVLNKSTNTLTTLRWSKAQRQ